MHMVRFIASLFAVPVYGRSGYWSGTK